MNMIKALSYRFEKCLGPFSMLLVEGSCEALSFSNLRDTFPNSIYYPLIKKFDKGAGIKISRVF